MPFVNDSAKIELLEFAMPPYLMDGSFLSCYFCPGKDSPIGGCETLSFRVQKVIHDEVAIITRADQN